MPGADVAKALICSEARAFGILYVGPVLWLAADAGHYFYWVASALGFAAWIVLLAGRSRAKTALACAISSLTTLGNLPLAISLYIQRSGFNERFFHHLDASSVAVAWNTYRLEVLLAGLYWAIVTVAPLLAARARSRKPGPAPRPILWLAAAVGLAAYAPAISLAAYGQARLQARNAPAIVIPRAVHDEAATPSGSRPNLVLIVAESLEATFGNAELMGEDLTPALSTLERDAVRFANIIQLASASWTMGGIVASQCSVPLPLPERWVDTKGAGDWPYNPLNILTGAIEHPLQDRECLGDILARHGYRNVHIGSDPLTFAGKSAFLATHGFEEQYGLNELRGELADPEAHGPWGLYDDDLFAIAWRHLEALAAQARPFSLMLLTVDTHSVTQRDISPSCGRAPLIHSPGFTLRCTDRVIADFIARLRATWPDTVVVLMSDHLAFPNPIVDRVETPDARRLRFVVWGPELEPREIPRRGTHFDIAPTVLDILGLEAYRRHNLGASLLAFDSPWFAHDTPQELRVAPALLAIHIEPGEPIIFEKGGSLIRVDSESLIANYRGFPLRDAVFTMRFHDDGRFDMALPWQDFDDLEKEEAGSLVVGVSTNASFNRAAGGPADMGTLYFAGRLGGEAGLMIGVVDDRTEIELPETMFGQLR